MIDAHHHLWRYTPEEYGWMSLDMQPLRRNFLPSDLRAVLRVAGIAGAIAVQARQTAEETEWLLDLANTSSEMLGVVGWAPLATSDLLPTLARWRDRPKLKGLRHVIQDEPDDRYILSPEFNRGIAQLLDTGLVYDILIHARHLPHTTEFVQRHPQQVFVLDHLAKPLVREQQLEPWREGLLRLAEHGNVFCKLSGLVTEADWSSWSPHQIEPYLDIALEAFGAERLLAGSDWPVCLLASSHARWWSLLEHWARRLRPEQREQVMGENARRIYRLDAAALDLES